VVEGGSESNPIGSILSTKLMLEWLGEREAASKIEEAVRTILASGKNRTKNFGIDLTTFEVGDEIASIVEA
jgi:isocitrate/isopropylmalate dehydrogenase